MDVVYILGTGSKCNNDELRYSLRSLQYMKHDRVFIIGERPDWLTNIEHVPADDIYGEEKQRNAIHKIRLAVNSDVSDDFIFMNDDFFLLRPMEPVNLHRRTLAETLEIGAGLRYEEAIRATWEMYPDGLDYDLHTPMVFNKAKLAKALEVTGDRSVLIRSVYGNMFNIDSEQRRDIKIFSRDQFKLFWNVMGFEGHDCISTSDEAVLSDTFQAWSRGQFPEASVYELS